MSVKVWFEAPTVELSSSGQESPPLGDDEGAIGDDEPGFLELLSEMETGIQSLVQTMGAATTIIQDISAVYAEATDSVHKVEARGGGASARLAVAELTAAKLTEQASRLEVVSGEFARTVDRIEPGIRYLLGRLANEPDQLAEVPEFPQQIQNLCDAARTSIEGASTMRANILEIGKASRSLKRAGERLAPSFKRFADTSSRIAEWSTLVDRDEFRSSGEFPGQSG